MSPEDGICRYDIFKYVDKKVIIWKQRMHQRSESVEGASFMGQTKLVPAIKVSSVTLLWLIYDSKEQENKIYAIMPYIWGV